MFKHAAMGMTALALIISPVRADMSGLSTDCFLTPEERGKAFEQMLNNETDPIVREKLTREYMDAIVESKVHPNDPATQKKVAGIFRKIFGVPERCQFQFSRYPTHPAHPPPQTGGTGAYFR